MCHMRHTGNCGTLNKLMDVELSDLVKGKQTLVTDNTADSIDRCNAIVAVVCGRFKNCLASYLDSIVARVRINQTLLT